MSMSIPWHLSNNLSEWSEWVSESEIDGMLWLCCELRLIWLHFLLPFPILFPSVNFIPYITSHPITSHKLSNARQTKNMLRGTVSCMYITYVHTFFTIYFLLCVPVPEFQLCFSLFPRPNSTQSGRAINSHSNGIKLNVLLNIMWVSMSGMITAKVR